MPINNCMCIVIKVKSEILKSLASNSLLPKNLNTALKVAIISINNTK